MYAREIYGLMMAGAILLIAGCSADDVVKETTSEEAIAISFSCNYDDPEEHPTRAGHQGVMNTEDLYTTGFGVMASVTAGTGSGYNKPDLMYNQKVEFTFVGDMTDPLKGYWSYSPLKYWPTDLTHCYISAYAPYVDPAYLNSLTPEQRADELGIYGISANNVPPYVDYRRCEKPNEVVDLLWYYVEPASIPAGTAQQAAGTLNMKMRHALARLEIKVVLAADEVIDLSTTKVLIEKITLTGKMAKTGRLSLCSQKTAGSGVDTKYYPVWSNQVFDKDGGGDDIDHTIEITNEDNDPDSYGIIDAQVRYIPGMPYAWQPEGLKKYDGDLVEKDYNYLNALSTGDRKGYVYLIPQDGPLELTVKVKYHKMTAGNDDVKTKTTTATFIEVGTTVDETKKLYGNTTYTLYIKLSNLNSI